MPSPRVTAAADDVVRRRGLLRNPYFARLADGFDVLEGRDVAEVRHRPRLYSNVKIHRCCGTGGSGASFSVPLFRRDASTLYS